MSQSLPLHWDSARYRDHLRGIFGFPPTDVLDLTGCIECGDFIAAGGSGQIFKGKWLCSSNVIPREQHALPKVAMKLISVPAILDEKQKSRWSKRMQRELELWSKINHRNILPFVGIARIGGDGSRLAYISPWMEYGNITHFLRQNPTFPAVSFLHDIIKGLHYLHTFEPEIIHGDLKAANVLVNYRKEAYLCDFGLSRCAIDDTLWRTNATQAGGTLRWMAPELIEGEQNTPTKSSDIYSYAMTCYEIFSGRIPFEAYRIDAKVMRKVLDRQRPERIISCHPDRVWSIITWCWEQNPDDRPSTSYALRSVIQLIEGSDEFWNQMKRIGKSTGMRDPCPEKACVQVPGSSTSPSSNPDSSHYGATWSMDIESLSPSSTSARPSDHGHQRRVGRPCSVSELSSIARERFYDETESFERLLWTAQQVRKQARDFIGKGDLQNAFISLTRASTLVIDKLPSYREYYTSLEPAQRTNLNMNSLDIWEELQDIKLKLTKQYEEWTRQHSKKEQLEPPQASSSAVRQGDTRPYIGTVPNGWEPSQGDYHRSANALAEIRESNTWERGIPESRQPHLLHTWRGTNGATVAALPQQAISLMRSPQLPPISEPTDHSASQTMDETTIQASERPQYQRDWQRAIRSRVTAPGQEEGTLGRRGHR